MSVYSFPPLAAALTAAHALVLALVDALSPLLAAAAAPAAIVIVTLAVRLALVPVAVASARAERTRRRIAPQVARLRDRHRKDPARLQRELAELYRREGVSPARALLPLLVQAPVLTLVFGVVSVPVIGGVGNELMAASLAGVPLAAGLAGQLLAAPTPPVLAVAAAVTAIAVLGAELSRRTATRAAARFEGPRPPRWAGTLRAALPYAALPAVALVPLGAALYLVTSGLWGAVERAILTA
ncbi:MAG TPA: membrane protein insertase YidC [Naasia sp.]|jgi:YidC/Oxa1 family membrane protein insertase